MIVHFIKMQAVGNDFILIDELKNRIVSDTERSRFVAKICDRHFGVGSDGVIFVRPSNRCDVKFVFYNPDGSEAEMCGNGMRCFIKYVYERGISRKSRIRVETRAGIIEAEPILKGSIVKEVRLDMGRPSVKRRDIPVMGPQDDSFVNQKVEIEGKVYWITAVGMGNPHAVIFVDDVDSLDVMAEGKKIREKNLIFPNGVNVNFVQKINYNEFKIRTYERGVESETLACGTGICASAVAAFLNNLAEPDEVIVFHARGGTLHVELVLEADYVTKVFLLGPVEEVFSGEVKL